MHFFGCLFRFFLLLRAARGSAAALRPEAGPPERYRCGDPENLRRLRGWLEEEAVEVSSAECLDRLGEVPKLSFPFPADPRELRCGDSNSEVEGGRPPGERRFLQAEFHFILCVLATPAKLASYTEPRPMEECNFQAAVEWGRKHTDCDIEDMDGYLFLAKPAPGSPKLLLDLAKACFEYEATQDSPSLAAAEAEGGPGAHSLQRAHQQYPFVATLSAALGALGSERITDFARDPEFKVINDLGDRPLDVAEAHRHGTGTPGAGAAKRAEKLLTLQEAQRRTAIEEQWVQLFWGQLLGYKRSASFEYLVDQFKVLDRRGFDALYDLARSEFLGVLKKAFAGDEDATTRIIPEVEKRTKKAEALI